MAWLSPSQPSSPPESEAPVQRTSIQKLGLLFQTFPKCPGELFGPGFHISSRYVPKDALSEYRRGLGVVANLIIENPDMPEAWALFFLYDAMTLAPCSPLRESDSTACLSYFPGRVARACHETRRLSAG